MENRVERFDLLPGVELLCLRTDRFKTGCLSFSFLRDMGEENSANALLMPVLLRGTESYPDIESLSCRMDELYGADFGVHMRQKGESLRFGISGDFIDDRFSFEGGILRGSAGLLSELMGSPAGGGFLPEYFDSERENLLDAIAARRNNKQGWAMRRMLEIMFKGERYSLDRLGSAEVLEGLDVPGLREHWQRLLKESPIQLFYGGSEEPQKVRDMLLEEFSFLKGRGDSTPLTPTGRKSAGEPRFVTETMDVTQGKLAMGWRWEGEGTMPYGPSVVFNSIFGGITTSKLFMNVRERLSLCYSVDSNVDRRKGVAFATAGMSFADYERCRDEILAQLAACTEGNITQEELEGAKAWIVSALKSSGDSLSGLEDYYGTKALYGEEIIPPAELIPQVERVTAEEAAQVAAALRLDTVYFLRGEEEEEE